MMFIGIGCVWNITNTRVIQDKATIVTQEKTNSYSFLSLYFKGSHFVYTILHFLWFAYDDTVSCVKMPLLDYENT